MTLAVIGGVFGVIGGTLAGQEPTDPGATPVVMGAFARTTHHNRDLDDTAVSRMTVQRLPAMVSGTGMRLQYGHFYRFEDPLPTAPITVRAAVRGPDSVLHRVYFDGQTSVTLQPGDLLFSDDVAVAFAEGEFVEVLTWVTTTAAGQIPRGVALSSTAGDRYESPGTDITGGGTIAAAPGGSRGYGPVRIDALSTSSEPSVVVSGSSSSQDPTSYLPAALAAAGVPHINVAQGGDAAYLFKLPAEHARRLAVANSADYVISQYGPNDLGFSGPDNKWVQVAQDLMEVWALYAAQGATVYQCTITPLYVESSDGYLTPENQTPSASNPARTLFNDWLRAGGPVNGSTPAAPGQRATGFAPNLAGFYEVADRAETFRNSGRWTTDAGQALTGDGQHPNAVGDIWLQAAITPLPPVAQAVPGVPTGLTASPGDGQVTLTWSDPAGATSVGIYQGGALVSAVVAGTQTVTITGLTNGQAKSFTVDASNRMGARSAKTTPVSTTPLAPTGPPALVASASSPQQALTKDLQITMPAGVQAGDRLVVFIGSWATAATMAPPPGWTARGVAQGIASDPTTAPQMRCLTKTADGSESGTTVTFSYSASPTGGASSAVAYCLRNVPEAPVAFSAVSGAFASTQAVPTLSGVPAGVIVLTANVFDRGPTAINSDISTTQGWVQDAEIQGVGGTNPVLLSTAHLTDVDGGTTPAGTWTANAARQACQITAAFGS